MSVQVHDEKRIEVVFSQLLWEGDKALVTFTLTGGPFRPIKCRYSPVTTHSEDGLLDVRDLLPYRRDLLLLIPVLRSLLEY